MTDRLYYSDPSLREFDAEVVRVEPRGNGILIVLDRTAFYPTSGGQPFDTGELGAFRVTDVVDDDEGTILHLVEPSRVVARSSVQPGALPAVGDMLHGIIDWPRRFDHMQQHTGQHVLSAAFDRLFRARTVSFHLGASASTIDLAREVSAKEIGAAEDEANRIVWEDRPVSIRYATADEAARLPLRKESGREGTLRLIDVLDFDLSACGGTHVARTGAVGLIAVGSAERFKGGSRIEFLCGGRALTRFRSLRDIVAAATRLLSTSADDVPASIERLQGDAKSHARERVRLHAELSTHRANDLAEAAETIGRDPNATGGEFRFVARAVDGDAGSLKALASAVSARDGFVVVLLSTARPALAVVARSAELALDASEILGGLMARFGGRGGGRPEMAQGGGLDAAADEILTEARALVMSSYRSHQ